MTARLRVVLLTSYPTDHASFTAGVQTATAALLEGLRGHADELDLHVVSSAEEDLHESRDGISFHFLASPRAVRPRFPFRAARAGRLLRRLGPDVVHCQDTLVLALGALRGPWAKVFTVHGIKRAEARVRSGWEGWSSGFEALLQRRVQARMDAVVCNSDYSASMAGAARVFRIPNAVPPALFEAERTPAPGGRLLFVGALTPSKGPRALFDAHAELRRAHPALETSFCGPVEDAAYFESMRAASPPGVVWEGVVPRQRLTDLLREATALVLPSLQENVPMVIAEAMAAGVPVVASRVGGIPEMVEDGVEGLLVPPGDGAALRGAIEKLLSDPSAVESMGKAGRERAGRAYSPQKVGAATVAMYRELA